MSKNICIAEDKKIGLFEKSVELNDGKFVCSNCWKKVYGDTSPKKIDHPDSTTFLEMLQLEESKDDGTANPAVFVADEKSGSVEIDSFHKLVSVNELVTKKTIIPISDIIKFEIDEEGETVTTHHGIRRAIVGGALTGGAGAIVGAVTGKKRSKPTVDWLRINIYTANNGMLTVNFIDKKGTKKSSIFYKMAKQSCAVAESQINKALEIWNDYQKELSATPNDSSDESVPDQLRELKQLVDDGIITQDDFDAKKKQLLNL